MNDKSDKQFDQMELRLDKVESRLDQQEQMLQTLITMTAKDTEDIHTLRVENSSALVNSNSPFTK